MVNIMDKKSIDIAKEKWEQFGDIPVNDDDEIEQKFEGFEVGTDRIEIWHWFEDTFNVSVAKDLMEI